MPAQLDEEAIFQAARLITDSAARCDYLDNVCHVNDSLRRRVEMLLEADATDDNFLRSNEPAHTNTVGQGSPDSALNADRRSPALAENSPSEIHFPLSIIERVGLKVGRYKLLEQIGEGGMGTVWVAEQTEPVKRRVALKLIKPGMDSRQVLSRFEAERQALALMDHPNIAKVYDGGMTEEGRPFFVMEYVRGVPITEYCDNVRLSIQDRLKLFIRVCQAVQHAHQKGIIHRDLKPSNILVCLYDGQPVPKVIDFGLAKAMHQPLTEHTLYTAHGLMVGTPLYMSPEQAEFNNLDVDTRTDIYSLGVILYELLTGTTPLQKLQFKDAAFQEILRLIKEVEPQRPSLKISTSMTLPAIAAQRSLDPSQLSRTVRGDLDWIVMKSLEKERSRRYETATSLARDIERYLDNEPVLARPPSTSYRLRKYTQRHKVAVAAGLLVALSLLIGTIISTWLAVRATSAESLAQQRLVQEQQALNDAKSAREDTAHQLNRAVAAEKESQANLQSLQQVAREWATSETLTGDPERAEAAIRLAEAAQVSKAWTEILRAQSDLDQGRPQDAATRLKPITVETYQSGDDDTQLAALSLLAHADIQNGDISDMERCIRRVREFRHDLGPEAGLFRAEAEFWAEYDPVKAVASIEAATKKRFYPASLLLLAKARAMEALQQQNHGLVRQAQQHLEFAELFAGNSPAVLAAKLRVHGYGHEVAVLLGNSHAAEAHLLEVASCLPQLEKLPKSVLNTFHLANAYARLDQWKKGLDVEANTDWGHSIYIQYAAAHLYERVEDPQAALAKFEQLQVDEDSPDRLISRAYFCAEIADKRGELLGLLERIVAQNPDSVVLRYRAMNIWALLGKPKALRDEARITLDRLGGAANFLGLEQVLHYLAGDWNEEQALNQVSSSAYFQSTMHYAMGMERVACGDRDGARRHFEECLKLASFESISRAWARARLARMDRDPNWPDWIEKKSPAENTTAATE
jgi:serine/threonine protein kinase